MNNPNKNLTERQIRARAHLQRPRPNFTAWRKKNPEAGQHITGEGVYLGRYELRDENGLSLGKIFNVFAAPQDLPEIMKYEEAIQYIARLKDWHGFDGTNYENDKEMCAALKDGSYTGGWFIPPCDIMVGRDAKGNMIQPDNFVAHQDKGAFKDTFKTAVYEDLSYLNWYWSSTEDPKTRGLLHIVQFPEGHMDWDSKVDEQLRCRLVRLVPLPSV